MALQNIDGLVPEPHGPLSVPGPSEFPRMPPKTLQLVPNPFPRYLELLKLTNSQEPQDPFLGVHWNGIFRAPPPGSLN